VALQRRLTVQISVPIAVLGAGDGFGLEALFGRPYTTDAVCLVESLLLVCAAKDLQPLFAESALVARNTAAMLDERLKDVFATFEGIANERIVTRVHDRLKALRGQYGVAVSDGTLLDIELAADDVAAVVGASPVVVAQALAFLHSTQAIRINGTSITLLTELPKGPVLDP
jgi:CRP-like cAMP-binding protein